MKFTLQKVVDCADWDELVKKTYGKEYHFQQQNDCQERGQHYITVPDPYAEDFERDSIPVEVNGRTMGVSLKAWLGRDPKEKFFPNEPDYMERLFWQRNFYPSIEMLANDLHSKGLIEAGKYTIDIDW